MAKPWFKIPPRWKLMPPLALAAAMVLLAAGVVMAFYQDELYRSRTVRETTAQAEILAATVTAALSFNDETAAREYVNALSPNPDIEAAAIYDAAGNHVAGFHRRDANPAPRRAVAARAPAFADNRLLVTVPVMQNGSRLGTVYLRVMTESLERRLTRYGAIMLLATMAALVLAVLGAAHRALTRANTELEERASDLAEANVKLQMEMEEREKAEDALRQSQKMEAIGQLSGGIAHDFNNLLTIIKGNLQLLQRRVQQGSHDVQRYIDPAMEGLARGASLTQRILAFSRRQPLSPQPVNLSQLVGDMGDLLKHSVGETVTLQTYLNAEWWTKCDTNQMENVILNIAINARDAMPAGGWLTVETDDVHIDAPARAGEGVGRGDYVRLIIRDTGTGMSEEVRERAIDPFFTTKPPGQGTGLGLSMTFGYIRQSNGHLTIDSEPGLGTTITILMPRFEHEATSEEPGDGIQRHG
jgi:signal transduction histidine kinase